MIGFHTCIVISCYLFYCASDTRLAGFAVFGAMFLIVGILCTRLKSDG